MTQLAFGSFIRRVLLLSCKLYLVTASYPSIASPPGILGQSGYVQINLQAAQAQAAALAQASQSGYGMHSQMGYGSMPSQSGHGMPSQMGYGSMPSQSGYSMPSQMGYGSMPSQTGYGSMPSGYGSTTFGGYGGHGYVAPLTQGNYPIYPQQYYPQPHHHYGGYGNMSTNTTTTTTTPAPVLVKKTCADSSFYCAIWALFGECVKNKDWMLNNCAVSCSNCYEIFHPSTTTTTKPVRRKPVSLTTTSTTSTSTTTTKKPKTVKRKPTSKFIYEPIFYQRVPKKSGKKQSNGKIKVVKKSE